MKRRRGLTLYGRTVFILGLAFLLFELLSYQVVQRTLILPVADRSAKDLAGLIILSVQTWVELPPVTRPAFEQELAHRHGLRVVPEGVMAREPAPDFAFRGEIERALSQRLGFPVRLYGIKGTHAVWLDVPMGGWILQVGFFPNRYAVHLPLAAIVLFSLGTFLTLLTAILLMQRVTVPLARAVRAAQEVGAGRLPEHLPETGPRELAELARRFNRMAREVRELLDNRTTLLAGISHDLRTPLTRLRLALEMQRETPDPARLERMAADLEEMNGLIQGYLELARMSRPEPAEAVDLGAWLAERAARFAARYTADKACRAEIALQALGRIVDNLLENARRYGDGTVELRLDCAAQPPSIEVLDRGPGIPEAELDKVFRPFYRLEQSRAKATGGTGLGLAIVRQLAAAQGWKIELANRPGGGLAARLKLG